jgi:hypothetical protein
LTDDDGSGEVPNIPDSFEVPFPTFPTDCLEVFELLYKVLAYSFFEIVFRKEDEVEDAVDVEVLDRGIEGVVVVDEDAEDETESDTVECSTF